MVWKLTSRVVMDTPEIKVTHITTLAIVICICNSVMSDMNYSNYSNELEFSRFNDSITTEMFMCENASVNCYPHSEGVTPDLVQFSTEVNVPSTFKTTTVTIENTTSLPPTRPSEMKRDSNDMLEKKCQCDFTPNICDINCCCDDDCNKWEREAFSKCISFSPPATFGQCITSDIIYKNNTPYPVSRSVSGLMCISKDNFPERNAYLDQEVIKSIQTFERIWKRKVHYYWTFQAHKTIFQLKQKELYKYGEPIWRFMNYTNETTVLGLPDSITSNMCLREQSIYYLKDYESTCFQVTPKTKEECTTNKYLNARYYCQDFIIVSSSSLINSSNIADSPEETFVTVKQYLCQANHCNETSTYPEPTFDTLNGFCGNIVKSVLIIFRHNGSLGIKHAECRITLYSSAKMQILLEQKFEVSYLPAHIVNSSITFKRSGTPGYRPGMPVLKKVLKDNQYIVPAPFTILGGKDCTSSIPVGFKENVLIQCVYNFPRNATLNCTHLEEQIINKMLEGVGEVGVTGDPDTWLQPPFTLISASTSGSACKPVTSLSLDFIYSYTGSLQNPEAKINGLMSRFDNHRAPECSVMACSLRLVTVVSFTDASRPVMSKYASAPVVKIKLPKDFFYPFSSSAISVLYCTNCIFVIKCILVILSLTNQCF